MSQTVLVWFVVLAALCAVNMPFVSHRLMAVLTPLKPKALTVRLAELVVFGFVAGGLGLPLEKRAGQIAPQTWEFYAITATLLVTFAFPGFVYRYLLKHRN